MPAQLFNNESHALDVYGQDVEVDYRGYEVTVSAFLQLLTGGGRGAACVGEAYEGVIRDQSAGRGAGCRGIPHTGYGR